MANGLSIHLGLNGVDKKKYGGWDGALAGCENDARDMAAIAKAKGFTATVLLTRQATAEALLDAMADAAKRLKARDILLLTYSGHGGQVPDTNGDEEDAKDETWVCYDRQVIDDELYALYAKFREGVRIFILSDSCHSGTVARAMYDAIAPVEERNNLRPAGGFRSKAMPLDDQFRDGHARGALYADLQQKAGPAETLKVGANVLLISGCQDNQLSSDGDRNGLFTERLLQVWDGGRFRGGYPRFHREIVARMPASQTPNLFLAGKRSRKFELQTPFTIQAEGAAARR